MPFAHESKQLDQSAIEHLADYDRAHLVHPNYYAADHEDAILFDRGDGAVLIDVHGKRYIDALSSLWNVAAGHGRAELAEAASAQMRKLAFNNSYTGYANLPSIELTQKLLSLAYPGMDAVFYASSGSEANDFAIKAARYFWFVSGQPAKTKIISRADSYHGGTMAATALTGMAPFHRGFGPEPPGFIQVPTCYPYRCQWCAGRPACTLECADNIDATIEREGADTVAAVVAEPVHGAGGVLPPDPGYWPRLREICDSRNVLLIADEVITGFGRTGRWFALEHWAVQPDIMTFAKAITSAYVPLSGFLMSARVHHAILDAPPDTKFMIGCTNSAHPTACAVALRNLQIIEDEGLVQRAERMGQRLYEQLGQLREMPHVGNIRGFGLLAAVEIVENRETRAPFAPASAVGAKIVARMRDRGVVTRAKGDSILFAPPLIVSETELDTIVNVAAEAIEAVVGGMS